MTYDRQTMDQRMLAARQELEHAAESIRAALDMLRRAGWMAETSPDGCYPWRESCRDLLAAADRAKRNVFAAAQTGPMP